MKRPRVTEATQAWLYLSPAAVVLGLFCLFPIGYVVYISLFDNWATTSQRFVGLANYASALGGREFWQSLLITFYYVLGTMPVAMLLAFVIANLLFKRIRGLAIYRTIYFLPYITSTVAAAAAWGWIFHPGGRGIMNQIMQHLGLPVQRWTEDAHGIFAVIADGMGFSIPDWMGGPSIALISVMIFSIWHALGFDTVIFLAGLTAIPKELYEAAQIDGAGTWSTMRRVTLPLLMPTIFFLAVVSTIRSFQTFNQIYIMAPQERLGSCRNVTMLIFSHFYDDPNEGYAAAVALLLFAIILLLTIVQVKVIGRRAQY